jgi:hypothetical protein
MPESNKQWIKSGDGDWKEVDGPGGWVQVKGKDWDWEWVSGFGKWINKGDEWVWEKLVE